MSGPHPQWTPVDLVTTLRYSIQEFRELGVRGSAFRAWWEFRLRSGLASHLDRTVARREQDLASRAASLRVSESVHFGAPRDVGPFLETCLPADARADLLRQGRDSINGHILCFSRLLAKFGQPIQWSLNPSSGLQWQKDVHWTAALANAERIGDIKFTWEVARLPHAYRMARAGALYPQRTAELHDSLVRQLESFEREAPFGRGVHWYSGQEVAVRLVAILFAHIAFGHPPDLEPILYRALCRTGLHIQSHIEYARESVFNNHLIWEALGLFISGRLLEGIPEASQWESTGRSILDRQAEKQFYRDGGYLQQSHTYHRMALQAYLVASRLLPSLPTGWRDAMERSLDFLLAQQDPESGRLPNFGANDGTLPCVLSTCDYGDFRPTLQAVSLLTRGERIYPVGPWDEEAAWLAGPSVLNAPLPRRAFGSRSFPDTGMHVLRGREPHSFGVFRCGSLRDRFGQIDMLHLDVWWRGHNVLTDPGSYLYNGPQELHNHFFRTASHNTVQIDGRDQMVHFRKFKTLYPTKANLLHFEDTGEIGLASGEHFGYRRHDGCVHRRTVLYVKDDLWIVVDKVLGQGSHQVRLHWQAGPYPVTHDGMSLQLHTPAGAFSVTTYDDCGRQVHSDVVGGSASPPRGWVSRYYGHKTPAPSYVVEVQAELPLQFVSVLGSGAPMVECSGSRWAISADRSSTEFTLTDSDIDPASVRVLNSEVMSRK